MLYEDWPRISRNVFSEIRNQVLIWNVERLLWFYWNHGEPALILYERDYNKRPSTLAAQYDRPQPCGRATFPLKNYPVLHVGSLRRI